MGFITCVHDWRTEACWYDSDDGAEWLTRFVAAERAHKVAFIAAVRAGGVDFAQLERDYPLPELPVLTCVMMRLVRETGEHPRSDHVPTLPSTRTQTVKPTGVTPPELAGLSDEIIAWMLGRPPRDQCEVMQRLHPRNDR